MDPLNIDLQSVYTELYYRSKEIDYPKGQMEALLRISTFKLRRQKDYDKVILDMSEAEKIALKIENYSGITKSKILRGRAYFFSGLPQYAIKELREALETSKKIEDADNRIIAKIEIYSGYSNYYEDRYNLSKDKIYMDSCIYFLKQKYSQAILMKKNVPSRNKLILTALKSLSGINLTLENYNEVEYYLDLMEKNIKDTNDKFILATYHKLKGEFEFKNARNNVNYLDSALYHFDKAEFYAKEIQNTQLLELIYPEMANVFDQMKDKRMQIKYLEKTKNIKDSLQIKKKEYLQKIYPLAEKKLTKTEMILPDNNADLYKIAGILALFIVTGWYWYYKKNGTKESSEKSTAFDYNKIKESSKIIIPIEKLVELASKDDGSFIKMFHEYLPAFMEKLLKINSTLKTDELEICAFIKLNFDTKKIASIKDFTVRAVESKKFRIRKKLNLSKDDDLHTWMSNIN
ncbi:MULTISPECIES: helix-turn-helix transcriptional regulator [unclassified Chryseobacterium]|uniref:helix-turn-helix transcriptional regulator n=1 Tax=unclassified Chryseobacterium TaxID=2593645 RepID=UPI00103B2C26|nr:MULTISPECIES: hypothetical protein [unclassified Chryseobacterium]